MYLIFDTETTGLPKSWNAPITDTDNWPRCIQIAWQLHDALGNLIEHRDFLLQPEGFNIQRVGTLLLRIRTIGQGVFKLHGNCMMLLEI